MSTYKFNATNRGFSLIEFTDRNGRECTLQKSSSADAECIWLGQGSDRMHLSQDDVTPLIQLLQYFEQTGELPESFEDCRTETETPLPFSEDN